MEDQPHPHVVPFVPLDDSTISANIVWLNYGAGTFQLQLVEQRHAPVNMIGEFAGLANFEVGRYALTPLALRYLEREIANALRAYETAMGSPLPSIAKFESGFHVANLERDLGTMPRPPEAEPPKGS
jgi:hypothetical protein